MNTRGRVSTKVPPGSVCHAPQLQRKHSWGGSSGFAGKPTAAGDVTSTEKAHLGHDFSQISSHAETHTNSLLAGADQGTPDSSGGSRFSPTRSPTQPAAGDQLDESEGVVLGGDGGATEADAPTQVGVLGGNATSISTSDLSAAQWNNNGQFKWWIKWTTDGTSGWIVQRIDNTYSGNRADGTAITNATVGATPSYYEAWAVASDGSITGSLGGTGNRDRWDRPALGPLGSTTSFSLQGTVFWTSRDPASSGFTSGGVPDAGSLLSSTSAPAGIGSSLLVRHAYGTWASNGSPALPGCFTS